LERVVITGLGTVNPLGNNIKSYWKNIKNGNNGIKKISLFDTSDFKVKIAGEVKIDLQEYFSTKDLNKLDRFSCFAIIAADQAIKDSNIDKLKSDRIGVIFGSGIGGIISLEEQHKRLLNNPKKVSPYFIPKMISDIVPGHISIKHGFTGPNYSVVSACASSNHAIGNAYNTIKYGDADIIITGGSEAGISPLSIAGFMNMKALTTNQNSSNASKPFDLNRDGFVMGEGSGVIIIESLSSAIKRNAKIYAEIKGYAATADAYHLTTPHIDGNGASNAMKIAIENSNLKIKDIDYINAHGTSTKYNDKVETLAIKKLFKSHSYNINISSTKSMIGHLLGAAGSVESIATILSLYNSFITPTINLETPDPKCDLNYTTKGITKNIKNALSNNFGFGGHNASIVFSKYIN
tara:strand:+ start:39 stop:1259 length:1221 start_codon:yes stop_codon:yes gene_type:complete